VAIWDFFIRQDRQAMRHLPRIGNWFGARFDDAWREAHGRSLYRNDLFTVVILRMLSTASAVPCAGSASGTTPICRRRHSPSSRT